MNHKRVYAIILITVVLGATLTFLVSQVSAQDDIATELRANLAQQGVPVKEVSIANRIPFQIEITIQSLSTSEWVTPDDPIFGATAQREVAAAKRRGIKIASVMIRIINVQGKTIALGDIPLNPALEAASVLPSEMDDTTLAQVIRSQVPVGNMTLDKLEVARDTNSAQVITITLLSKDIETANEAVPELMWKLTGFVDQLKTEHKAEIAGYRVNIFDADGQPLLKYVKDFLASEAHENWWQAPGMTEDWFPHPPPPTLAPTAP